MKLLAQNGKEEFLEMAATKKKKTKKKTYTYQEYVKNLRPKSLGPVRDSDVEPLASHAGRMPFRRKKSIDNKDLLASLRKDPEYKAAESHLETRIVLARNVLRYRAEHHLTQKQLAEKAGMKQPRIADLESMRSNPSLDTLDKIAAALKVRPSDLISPRPPQMTYKQPAQARQQCCHCPATRDIPTVKQEIK